MSDTLSDRHEADPATILIADDDQACLRMFACALREAGFRVRTASTGLEALRIAADPEIALVLTDLKMPHIDGYEALRQIRREADTRRLPVVAITGSTMGEDDEAFLRRGFDALLHKPCPLSELVQVVQQQLRSRAT